MEQNPDTVILDFQQKDKSVVNKQLSFKEKTICLVLLIITCISSAMVFGLIGYYIGKESINLGVQQGQKNKVSLEDKLSFPETLKDADST